MRYGIVFLFLCTISCGSLDALESHSAATVQPNSTFQFSGDATLEIFSFIQSEAINCRTLTRFAAVLPPDAKPLAREKADATNYGGEVSFVLNQFSPAEHSVIFVRVLELTSGIVYAAACEENVFLKAGQQRIIHLYLAPVAGAV